MHHQNQQNTHVPVLLDAVLTYLEPKEGDRYLDLTAGYGGHADAILKRTKNPAGAVLVDRDQNAVTILEEQFAGLGVEIIHSDFLGATRELMAEGRKFDVLLADLGVSSPHLTNASRGFAFLAEGPLDMRMDTKQTLTAEDILNKYPEDAIAEILTRYGEEPKARKIAHLITQHRPLKTTTDLASLVASAWPGHSKVHPATRTFQALRIAVNDELGQLEQSIPLWINLLAPGGRLAIISFHSLEDRIVKRVFADASGDRYDADLRVLTRHPVTADESEIVSNPRARSAKLRAVAKINNKQKGT
jgi:16S rRNA (cytosine1402-N4)-methyltransferase